MFCCMIFWFAVWISDGDKDVEVLQDPGEVDYILNVSSSRQDSFLQLYPQLC